jgi:hypothetical protein
MSRDGEGVGEWQDWLADEKPKVRTQASGCGARENGASAKASG